MSNSSTRVLNAIGFCKPDRLPRWDNFYISEGYGSEFTAQWQTLKNVSSDVLPGDYYDIDRKKVRLHLKMLLL
jgi:hypothetical protein